MNGIRLRFLLALLDTLLIFLFLAAGLRRCIDWVNIASSLAMVRIVTVTVDAGSRAYTAAGCRRAILRAPSTQPPN